jgi:two-component system sensor histidine kinase TctE
MLRQRLQGMTSDLRNRLLLLLLLPLCTLALLGVWMDYRSADEAAMRHDQRLLRLLPALADSVLAPGVGESQPVVWLMAPPIEDFLRSNASYTGYSVRDLSGNLLLGDDWVRTTVPETGEPEFHSVEEGGVTYRVAVQRGRTGAGELVVALADGTDPRQQWAQQLLLRVLLPNLLLVAAAGLAIHWAVGRAFKPLVDLADAVERRSPRDLSPIDEAASPAEVRPLVHSLNRLFNWSTPRPTASADSWPMPHTSCARRWRACRRRWKPGPCWPARPPRRLQMPGW